MSKNFIEVVEIELKKKTPEELVETIIEQTTRIIVLEKTIEKAIDFIESYGKNTALWQCDKNNLLNILKGSEE